MAENPATWGKAEYVVQDVLKEDDHQRSLEAITGEYLCGLSLTRRITDALRAAGLLSKEEK